MNLQWPTPWGKLSGEEKADLTYRVLQSLSEPLSKRYSTTSPGPMPLNEMMALHHVFGPARNQAEVKEIATVLRTRHTDPAS